MVGSCPLLSSLPAAGGPSLRRLASDTPPVIPLWPNNCVRRRREHNRQQKTATTAAAATTTATAGRQTSTGQSDYKRPLTSACGDFRGWGVGLFVAGPELLSAISVAVDQSGAESRAGWTAAWNQSPVAASITAAAAAVTRPASPPVTRGRGSSRAARGGGTLGPPCRAVPSDHSRNVVFSVAAARPLTRH